MAIILSVVFLLVYDYFVSKKVPKLRNKPFYVQKSTKKFAKSENLGKKTLNWEYENLGKVIRIETKNYVMKISQRGGAILSFVFKNYKDTTYKNNLEIISHPFLYDTHFYNFDTSYIYVSPNEVKEIRLVSPSGVQKIFKIFGGEYYFDVKLQSPNSIYFSKLNYAEKNKDEEKRFRQYLVKEFKGSILKYTIKKLKKGIKFFRMDSLNWFGFRTKYFVWLFVPYDKNGQVIINEQGFILNGILNGRVYVGPIIERQLKKVGFGAEKIVGYGWFIIAPISKLFLFLFRLFYKVVGNYGWAIVLIAILMKIVFTPLTLKSLKSMEKLKEMQPKIKALQKIYKDDPERLNKEIMNLYKEYGINPFSGCLPMLLQLPIIWALYQVLKVSIDFRQASFIFWIKDLSYKDPYYILPILWGLTSILQSLIQSQPQDKSSRFLGLVMPIIFVFILFNLPSGISLYWLVFNILSIFEILFIRRSI